MLPIKIIMGYLVADPTTTLYIVALTSLLTLMCTINHIRLVDVQPYLEGLYLDTQARVIILGHHLKF